MTGLHGEVLHELAVLAADASVSGRALARRLDASPEGVRKALLELVRHGIVVSDDAPPARLFRLNHEHLGASAVRDLVGLRSRLFERIATWVETWEPPPLHLSAYGSVARGDGTLESDIDLLLVAGDDLQPGHYTWHSTHGPELLDQITSWTGNRGEIAEYQLAELRTRLDQHDSLFESIKRDAVTIFGSSLDELVATAPAIHPQ